MDNGVGFRIRNIVSVVHLLIINLDHWLGNDRSTFNILLSKPLKRCKKEDNIRIDFKNIDVIVRS